jgi:hypothetical protein
MFLSEFSELSPDNHFVIAPYSPPPTRYVVAFNEAAHYHNLSPKLGNSSLTRQFAGAE